MKKISFLISVLISINFWSYASEIKLLRYPDINKVGEV